jgi:uncharacterized membrane protein YjjP (DUF1212 family)
MKNTYLSLSFYGIAVAVTMLLFKFATNLAFEAKRIPYEVSFSIIYIFSLACIVAGIFFSHRALNKGEWKISNYSLVLVGYILLIIYIGFYLYGSAINS